MLKIGLTGGIGSGKSTVAQIFETLGIPVFYADTETKKMMNEEEELKSLIIQHFGADAYKNNFLDRAYIASVVFNDAEKLSLLNSLTHPAIMKKGEAWMQQQTTPYAIHEAALIFEAGVNNRLDYVIGVFAPLESRIERVMKRDGINREEVLKRINRQMSEEDKIRRCDFVIANDEQQLLIPQVLRLHKQFISSDLSPRQ